MCTLTLLRQNGATLITMNRDDAAARPEAGPAIGAGQHRRWAAPRDMQAGGSWIAVNDQQIVACLLNRYDAAPPGRASRGQIVLEAAKRQTLDQACAALEALEHQQFSPFTCVLIDPSEAVRFDWNGAHLTQTMLAATDLMLTSSSWRYGDVSARRADLFNQIWSKRDSVEHKLSTFHSRRVIEQDAWAPMMQRETSETKSVTQVELTASGAEMRYWPRVSAIASGLTNADQVLRLGA